MKRAQTIFLNISLYIFPISLRRSAISLSIALMIGPLFAQFANAEKNALQFTTTSGGAGGGFAINTSKKFLNSKLPSPSQKSLDNLVTQMDRVRIIAGGEFNGKPLDKKVLLDSRDAKVLKELIECLKISEDPRTFGQEMNSGDPTLEIYAGGKRLAVLGYHHSLTIRWSKGWKFDGQLLDGRRFSEWFATNGVPGPKLEREVSLKENRQAASDMRKWAQSMPDVLKPSWQEVIGDSLPGMVVFVPEPSVDDENENPAPRAVNPRLEKLLASLDEAYKDKQSRTLALCQWFSSGCGKWTGYPPYEHIPGEILLMIPTEEIVAALKRSDVTEPELDGAARYFAWHTFRSQKPQDIKLLDSDLRQKLLKVSLKSQDSTKLARARLAFSDMTPDIINSQ